MRSKGSELWGENEAEEWKLREGERMRERRKERGEEKERISIGDGKRRIVLDLQEVRFEKVKMDGVKVCESNETRERERKRGERKGEKEGERERVK